MVKNIVFWSLQDIADCLKKRQENEFDAIIFISGRRGNGKSTLGFKLCLKFNDKKNKIKIFHPWQDIIYSRRDLMKKIENYVKKVIMDDEAIRSGYKRNFQEADQKLLIQELNMYRDNFNIYVACIPNFYALDKDLRQLATMHIHVTERGLGVIHLPNENLYSEDPWDVKYNSKIEESWAKKRKTEPDFKPPFYKLSTFAGYITFGKLKVKQEHLYKLIKATKRKAVFETEIKKEAGFTDEENEKVMQKILEKVKNKELTKETYVQICSINNLDYDKSLRTMNKMLKKEGIADSVKELLQKAKRIIPEEYKTPRRFGYT